MQMQCDLLNAQNILYYVRKACMCAPFLSFPTNNSLVDKVMISNTYAEGIDSEAALDSPAEAPVVLKINNKLR